MRNLFFLLLAFFHFQFTSSQIVIDIDADYYELDSQGELYLYRVNGEFAEEISFYVESDVNEEPQILINYYKISKNEIPKGVITIDSLKVEAYKNLLSSLKGKLFIENQYEKDYVNVLEFVNDYLFSIKRYYNKRKHNTPQDSYYHQWEFDAQGLSSFFIIRINHKKPIIALTESTNEWGYILPLQKELKIIWDRDFNFYPESELTTSIDSIKSLHKKVEEDNNLEYIFEIKNNTLRDVALGQNILEKEFDSLTIMNSNFIIGKEKDSIFVYNLFLKNITPKNLRAILPEAYGSEFAQVLVGNTLKFLFLDGSLYDVLPQGYGRYYLYADMIFDYDIKLKKILLEIDRSKYKSLDKFILNFARFELLNGKKGWLDINGNEYLDDEE